MTDSEGGALTADGGTPTFDEGGATCYFSFGNQIAESDKGSITLQLGINNPDSPG